MSYKLWVTIHEARLADARPCISKLYIANHLKRIFHSFLKELTPILGYVRGSRNLANAKCMSGEVNVTGKASKFSSGVFRMLQFSCGPELSSPLSVVVKAY